MNKKSGTMGNGRANGTFGEFLQGRFSKCKKSFIVTLPIKLYSYAKYAPTKNYHDVFVMPSYKTKAYRLINALREKFEIKEGGMLVIKSEIPEGKGLASSSADLLASARAFLDAYDLTMTNEELGLLLSSIEPTDGVMFNEVVAFYSQEGKCIENLGNIPKIYIIGIDEGGVIDTLEYNNYIDEHMQEEERRHFNTLLEDMIIAFKRKDINKIGNISTKSAEINQKFLQKKNLNILMDIKNKYSLPGVVITHSGTYSGLILDESSFNNHLMLTNILKELNEKKIEYTLFESMGDDSVEEKLIKKAA